MKVGPPRITSYNVCYTKLLRIDEGNKGGVDNNLVNLTDSNHLIINPYLVLLPLKTLQARFDYEYENIWYQDKAGDDAERHRYSCKFTQEITSRISADISGNFSQYRPRNQDRLEPKITAQEEYDRSDLSIGLLYNISDQLSRITSYNVCYTKLLRLENF